MFGTPVVRLRDHALEAILGGAAPSRSASSTPGRCRARPVTGEPIEGIYGFAIAEGRRYRDAGLDGLIVENHGDIPFRKPEASAPRPPPAWRSMADRVRRAFGLPLGINVLANGAIRRWPSPRPRAPASCASTNGPTPT